MRTVLFWLLLCAVVVWARSSQSQSTNPPDKSADHGQVTVRGCLSRANGDYILMQQNPGNTYELQASDKEKLGSHLGERVEITGTKSPTMETSSDALAKQGSASPVTITVTSIRMISKECRTR
jgi:hypothetical protein